jgi:DNA-binding NarL/FixJ family response regulator
VVDDNSDIRELIGQQLTLAGKYDVVGQAGDGAEAVDAAATLQPDVVLLDLSMPRMDGLQALPLVLAAVAGVRVVVMSGFAEAGMAERALAAGAVRYVEKGLRMNLLEVIDAVLSSGAEAGCSV